MRRVIATVVVAAVFTYPLACSDDAQVLAPQNTPDASQPKDSSVAVDGADASVAQDTSVADTWVVDAADAADAALVCDADAGLVACNGKCVDPTMAYLSDTANCGSCGHDCQGGKCTAGLCSVDTLTTNQNNPVAIAVDGTSIYFLNNGTSANPIDGALVSCPKAGCPNKLGPLTSGLNNPMALAIDATSIYWTNAASFSSASGSVMTCPLANCGKNNSSRKTLVSGIALPRSIAVDATNVYYPRYWTTSPFKFDGAIESCAIGGCNNKPTVVAPNQGKPATLTIDKSNAYWADWTQIPHIYTSPLLKPLVPVSLDSTNGSTYSALAVDLVNLYWADANKGAIHMCPLATCNNNSTVIASGISSPVAIAVDATGVYWADSGGDISMCKLSEGCATTYVLADKLDGPSALALDAKYVYWTNQGASDNTGSVMRVAK